MKKIFIVFFILGLLPFQGCDLNKCGECFTPPEPIALKIVNSNEENLISSGIYKKDSLRLFYFDGAVKKQISFEVAQNAFMNDVIYSAEISWLCVEKEKDIYLYLNYLDTDTLTLLLQKHSSECCTSFPIEKFKVNGEDIQQSYIDYTFFIVK